MITMTPRVQDAENYFGLSCADVQVYVMRLPGSQDARPRLDDTDFMLKNYRFIFTLFVILSAWSASFTFAQPQPTQQATTSFRAVHVIGLQDVKHNAKGKVSVSKDALEFTTGGAKNEIPISSIQDALTGADSQRLIGGTLGFLTTFAPYESGRFLSLFRMKIDTLTITYLDSGGGLHGAILTLAEGQAAVLKQQMVAQGVKTSVAVEIKSNQQTTSRPAKGKNL